MLKNLTKWGGGKLFVDLFGGSGLLSHVTKRLCPDATVIYNDFDNYRERLAHIDRTNHLIHRIRDVVSDIPRKRMIPNCLKADIMLLLEQEMREVGFVDFITLSSSLMFPSRYAMTVDEMGRTGMYNRLRTSDYDATGYLDGLNVVSCDYRELYEAYKDRSEAVFIIDPPYLSTFVGAYKMNWGLSDYLDVLSILKDHRFIYFTSSKSEIVELCEWLARYVPGVNPFDGAQRTEISARLNHSSQYTDIMLYKMNV